MSDTKWWNRSHLSLVFEVILLLVIIISDLKVWGFFNSNGYLPLPFYHSVIDTFMDWFNVAYWANNPGAYYEYMSVYPPLSFAFLKLFTLHSCYRFDPIFARDCDWLFRWVFGGFFLANAFLIYASLRKVVGGRAWVRTLALVLGLPSLFGVERGQLLIPCFTFFILAHGRLLRSARLKWLATAITINFKPYLLFTIIPHLLRRRWSAVEGCIIAAVLVWIVTWAVVGVGTPTEVIHNIMSFNERPIANKFDDVFYQMTYRPLLDAVNSRLPLMFFLGSKPIELIATYLPWIVRCGQAGILLCFAGAAIRPHALTLHRLTLLGLLLTTTSSMTGGYTQMLVFFLLFMEPWRGPTRIIALSIAYILSICTDYSIMGFQHLTLPSYLSGRTVDVTVGVSLGELSRPGLILIMEYALIVGSLASVFGALRVAPVPKAKGSPDAFSPTPLLS